MLIRNTIEVRQPVERVWEFFGDVPQVAACLPGATLDQDLGDDTYAGKVGIRMGPVRLSFDGKAHILSRDDATKTMVIDGAGSAEGGRGNAAMQLTAALAPVGSSDTRVGLDMDLQLSGAAAQYGRGMVNDVTKVLMGQFATNMQRRLDALARGEDVSALGAESAGGLGIALQATRMALARVFRRFFLPYQPAA
ncbi:SRPBCC family protein [Nocardioides sp. KR10-350]|uniref:SRPBCC family protein n=1 Tax=Nocardioides cheoyonin TaxID=3156615 RepID=UPI0032B4DECD